MSEITREDALAHFGKKGMKWGVRNETTGGRRRATAQEIGAARVRTASRLAQVSEAELRSRTEKDPAARAKAFRESAKLAKESNNSDDTRIAAMMTRGEKVVFVMATGPIGAVVVRSNTKQTSEENWGKRVDAVNMINAGKSGQFKLQEASRSK